MPSSTQDAPVTSTDDQGARHRRRHEKESTTDAPPVHHREKPMDSFSSGIVHVIRVLSEDSQPCINLVCVFVSEGKRSR